MCSKKARGHLVLPSVKPGWVYIKIRGHVGLFLEMLTLYPWIFHVTALSTGLWGKLSCSCRPYISHKCPSLQVLIHVCGRPPSSCDVNDLDTWWSLKNANGKKLTDLRKVDMTSNNYKILDHIFHLTLMLLLCSTNVLKSFFASLKYSWLLKCVYETL